ncbi:MAG TPA: hypothetical protein VM694_04220 [Polyangium sp.]|nr:hypothetical protein [Polyangium sp.]
MSDSIVLRVPLDQPAVHVDVAAGQTITLRGFYTSKHDGSILDAATTTWPKEAPGGASVDPVGLVEVEAGGFHLTKRSVDTHEAELLATGSGAEACAAAGVQAPCLVVNKRIALQKRLMGWEEFKGSLAGEGITAVLPPPPVVEVAPGVMPYVQAGAGVVIAAALGFAAWTWKKKRDASPAGQMLSLARGVKDQLRRADPVLAAPLAPAVDAAIRSLRERRVDPGSAEGKRVAEALRNTSARLDASMREEQAAKEQAAADELVQEMEAALEAADEVKRVHRAV